MTALVERLPVSGLLLFTVWVVGRLSPNVKEDKSKSIPSKVEWFFSLIGYSLVMALVLICSAGMFLIDRGYVHWES